MGLSPLSSRGSAPPVVPWALWRRSRSQEAASLTQHHPPPHPPQQEQEQCSLEGRWMGQAGGVRRPGGPIALSCCQRGKGLALVATIHF